jgi:pimeloyl-ACP methyl ester carboxylesterase
MARAQVAPGIELEYETFGAATDPALLLVTGYGSQLLSWSVGFCELLAARGRHVIRFDNRDSGLSTKLDGHEVALGDVIAAATAGDAAAIDRIAPYTLHTMADDAFGLLDALGIEQAHVVGSSMGGMIAQLMAIDRPERVLTLTSMMSSTGEPEYGQATHDALDVLFAPRPADREGFVASEERRLVWASKRYADLETSRAAAAASFDRSHYPQGTGRQIAAMIASGSRADQLRELTVPTLVIHGEDDTLVTPGGGERTAELVPGARLMLVPDMGHDRPEPLWPLLVDAIIEHTE